MIGSQPNYVSITDLDDQIPFVEKIMKKFEIQVKSVKVFEGGFSHFAWGHKGFLMPHCLHSVGSANMYCLTCDTGYYWDDASRSCLKCQLDGCLHCKDASSCLTCQASPSGLVDISDCLYGSCYDRGPENGQFYSPRCDWCGAVHTKKSCRCSIYQTFENNQKTCSCIEPNCKKRNFNHFSFIFPVLTRLFLSIRQSLFSSSD